MSAKKKPAKKKHTALARQADVGPVDTTPLGIMQRMARDPKLTVEKLERLMAMNERMMDRDAAAQFNEAYDLMVMHIPVINKRGQIKNAAGNVQSRYAKFEDIQKAVKPILQRFGFTFSYRTEWPTEGLIAEVVGVLTHNGGHFRESRFRSPADASGGKNAIQGLGSANAYGRRYTIVDLLNIVCEGVDDNGQKAKAAEPKPPKAEIVPSPQVLGGPVIAPPQRQRLVDLVHRMSRTEAEFKGWLKARYGWTSTAEITKTEYDHICRCVEASGPLPLREPGE